MEAGTVRQFKARQNQKTGTIHTKCIELWPVLPEFLLTGILIRADRESETVAVLEGGCS
jgi:hypothetical protein